MASMLRLSGGWLTSEFWVPGAEFLGADGTLVLNKPGKMWATRLLSFDSLTEHLAFSKRVGEILKVANVENPALHYRYYMLIFSTSMGFLS